MEVIGLYFAKRMSVTQVIVLFSNISVNHIIKQFRTMLKRRVYEHAKKYIQSNQLFKLKKRHRLFGMCYTGRQCSTYPVSICLGTPSIVSPWPWLTLNFCPEEPLHNITSSKAIELLDAIWNPCVV